MQPMFVKVAGVTFEGRQAKIAKLDGSEPVRLEPEPTNVYDSNAIAVKIAKDGEVLHCGYIPRDLAAKIAPRLQGESLMVKIHQITGGFEGRNGFKGSLGLLLEVEMPDEETSDIPF